jgi:hypothetical protein
LLPLPQSQPMVVQMYVRDKMLRAAGMMNGSAALAHGDCLARVAVAPPTTEYARVHYATGVDRLAPSIVTTNIAMAPVGTLRHTVSVVHGYANKK